MFEKAENILTLALIAIIGYFVYELFNSKGSKAVAQSVSNTTINAATGQLSQNQIDAEVQQEANSIIAASNGTVTMDQAIAQAQQDQTDLQNCTSCQFSFWDGVKASLGI